MNNEFSCLEKVTLLNYDSLVGQYIPTRCQKFYPNQISSEKARCIEAYNLSVALIKMYEKMKSTNHIKQKNNFKNQKPKSTDICIKIDNVQVTLLKNYENKEFTLFLYEDFDHNSVNNEATTSIYLYFARKHLKKYKCKRTGRIHRKRFVKKNGKGYKKTFVKHLRRKPLNYTNYTYNFPTLLRKIILGKLKMYVSSPEDELTANAIFECRDINNVQNSNPHQTKLLFTTREIRNSGDVSKFLNSLTKMDPFLKRNKQNEISKAILSFNNENITPTAIIKVTEINKQLYLLLTRKLRKSIKKKQFFIKKLKKMNGQKFVNSFAMNLQLTRLKLEVNPKYTEEDYESDAINISPSLSTYTSRLSVIESKYKNCQNLSEIQMAQTWEQKPLDQVIREAYRVLIELQLNCIYHCNKVYLNYKILNELNNSKNLQNLQQELEKHYSTFTDVQKKAIEKSLSVNRDIVKLNSILETMLMRTGIIKSNLTADDTASDPSDLQSSSDYSSDRKNLVKAESLKLEISKQTSWLSVNATKDIYKVTSTCTEDGTKILITREDLSNSNEFIELIINCNEMPVFKSNLSLIRQEIIKDDANTSTILLQNFMETQTELMPCVVEETQTDLPFVGYNNIQLMKDMCLQSYTGATLEDFELAAQQSDIISRKLKHAGISTYYDSIEVHSKKKSILMQIQDTLNTVFERLKASSQMIASSAVQTEDHINLEPTCTVNSKVLQHLSDIHRTTIAMRKPAEDNPQKQIYSRPAGDISMKHIDSKPQTADSGLTVISQDWKIDTSSCPFSRVQFDSFNKIPKPTVFYNTASKKSLETLRLLKTKQDIQRNLDRSELLMKKLNEILKRKLPNATNSRVLRAVSRGIQNDSSKSRVKTPDPESKNQKRDTQIMPTINSKYVSNFKPKQKVTKRAVIHKKITQEKKVGPETPIKPQDLIPKSDNFNKKPVIQTVYELPKFCYKRPKIFRPGKTLPVGVLKLSKLTEQDLKPFEPEYPRKDYVDYSTEENSYLHKLANSFDIDSLEPVMKCSNSSCITCRNLQNSTPNFIKSDTPTSIPRNCNSDTTVTEKKCRVGRFDFQKFFCDPKFGQEIDYNIYPVTVTHSTPKNLSERLSGRNTLLFDQKDRNVRSTTSTSAPPQKPSQNRITPQLKTSKVLAKNTSSTRLNQNRIQRSIQQAILKNQEKFRQIQRSIKTVPVNQVSQQRISHHDRNTSNNNLSNKNTNVTTKHSKCPVPQIITKNASLTSKTLEKKREFAVVHKPYIVSPLDMTVFDKKYSNKLSITRCRQSDARTQSTSESERPSSTPYSDDDESSLFLRPKQDSILKQISKSVRKSQEDMKKYIELVEQRFVKTFSLPETEKVTAYSNLECEIKQMLSLLSTKEKADVKKSKILKSVERLSKSDFPVKKFKTADEMASTSSRENKCTSSVIVIKEPKHFAQSSTPSSATDEVLKKKNSENAQPTICTESINFENSRSAIISKLPSVGVAGKQSGSSTIPVNQSDSYSQSSHLLTNSNTTTTASTLTTTTIIEEIRLHDDSTDSFDTISEDGYSTFTEETISTVSDFSLKNDFTDNIEYSLLIIYKICIGYSYVQQEAQVYCLINLYQCIMIFDLHPTMDKELSIKEKYFTKLLPEDCDLDKLNYYVSEPEIFSFKKTNYLDDFAKFKSINPKSKYTDFGKQTSKIDVKSLEADKSFRDSKSLSLERKMSPRVLEFLDIITAMETDNVTTKRYIYFQYPIHNSVMYQATVYCIVEIIHKTDYFEPGSFKEISEHLSDQIKQLTEILNINPNSTDYDTKIVSAHNENKQHNLFYSPSAFNSNLFNNNYRISLPLKDQVYNSDTAGVSQTLVLNLQVRHPKRRNQNFKTNKRTILKISRHLYKKNQFNKIKKLEIEFQLGKKPKTKLSHKKQLLKKILPIMYIAIFSLAYLCITLNYKCE